MSNRGRVTCEACDGSGVIVFAIRVYEHGCGFAHDSSDERPCEECHGTGKVRQAAITTRPEPEAEDPEADIWRMLDIEDSDDLPF